MILHCCDLPTRVTGRSSFFLLAAGVFCSRLTLTTPSMHCYSWADFADFWGELFLVHQPSACLRTCPAGDVRLRLETLDLCKISQQFLQVKIVVQGEDMAEEATAYRETLGEGLVHELDCMVMTRLVL